MAIVTGTKRVASKLGQIITRPTSMGDNLGPGYVCIIKGIDIPGWPHATWPLVAYLSTDHSKAHDYDLGAFDGSGPGGIWLYAFDGVDISASSSWQAWDNISSNAEFTYLFTATPTTPTTNPIYIDAVAGLQTETPWIGIEGGTLNLYSHNDAAMQYSGFNVQNTAKATGTDGINFTRDDIALTYNPTSRVGAGHTGYFRFGVNPYAHIPYTYIGQSSYGGGTAEQGGGGGMIWVSNSKAGPWEEYQIKAREQGRLADGDPTLQYGASDFWDAVPEGDYWRVRGGTRLTNVVGSGLPKATKGEYLLDETLAIVSYPSTYMTAGAEGEIDDGGSASATEFEYSGNTYQIYTAQQELDSDPRNSHLNSIAIAQITEAPHIWELLPGLNTNKTAIVDIDMTQDNGVDPLLTAHGGGTLSATATRVALTVSVSGKGYVILNSPVVLSDYDVIDFKFEGMRCQYINNTPRYFGIKTGLDTSLSDAIQLNSTSETVHAPLEFTFKQTGETTVTQETGKWIGFTDSWLTDGKESPQAYQYLTLRIIPSINKAILVQGISELDTFDITGMDYDQTFYMYAAMRNNHTVTQELRMSRMAVYSGDDVLAVPSTTYDFTGVNGDPLPAGLTAQNGTFEIQGNALAATGSDPLGAKWVATHESTADGTFTGVFNGNGASGDTSGVMFRYSDVNNMIYAVINPGTGILKLFKYEAGANVQLGIDYLIPSFINTINYTIEATALADAISVVLDGVDTGIAVTESFNQTETVSGVRIGSTEHRIDSLTLPDATVSNSITVTTSDFTFTKQIGGSGTITIDGTYTGAPTQIERNVDGAGWVVAVASPAGNAWSDSLTLATGQYSIEYRFSNDVGVTDTANYITIAKHVFACGFQAQSNMEGRGDNNQVYTDSVPSGYKACMYDDNSEFNELSDPWQSGGGSWFIRFVNEMYADDDAPIAVVTGAEGGTSAAEWVKGDALYDTLLAKCLAVGGITRNFMQQGERDSTLGTTATAYAAQTNQNINDVFTDLGVGTFIVPLQTITAAGFDGNGTTTGQDAIRAEQILIAASNANAEIGQPLTDIDLSGGDGLHFETDTELQTVATRMYQSFVGAATSTINITATNAPDGTYPTMIYNPSDYSVIHGGDLSFVSGVAQITSVSLAVGVSWRGDVFDGSNLENGARVYGVTE